uniref:Uncharacterized protein n=1 Tax=Candidatus Kentrum sp. FW TaxID=2126338 RepID=A0A450RU59_9GAMM|nr:MAG: hypothetical protein BECKFW1821A_GA0114235_100261 [Candidatus Kentron sp. FW]
MNVIDVFEIPGKEVVNARSRRSGDMKRVFFTVCGNSALVYERGGQGLGFRRNEDVGNILNDRKATFGSPNITPGDFLFYKNGYENALARLRLRL